MTPQQPRPDDLICRGDLQVGDPTGNIARLALSSRGSHDKAIEWLQGDILRIEKSKDREPVKAKKIGELKAAIWQLEKMKNG